jgi:hypothetical protein
MSVASRPFKEWPTKTAERDQNGLPQISARSHNLLMAARLAELRFMPTRTSNGPESYSPADTGLLFAAAEKPARVYSRCSNSTHQALPLSNTGAE